MESRVYGTQKSLKLTSTELEKNTYFDQKFKEILDKFGDNNSRNEYIKIKTINIE